MIRKLNITDISNNQNCKEKAKSNVAEVSTFNVGHSKSNKKSRYNKSNKPNNSSNKKTYKCLFCGSADHVFWKCDVVTTKDKRLDILKKDFPDNCTSCGFKHATQAFNALFAYCKLPGCKEETPSHTKLFCPKALKANPTSISQISTVPDQVNALNIRSTSVALPTAVYTAQNLKAKE